MPMRLRVLSVAHHDAGTWEQANILKAVRWPARARSDALDETFARELHRRMFDDTWRWAGVFRGTERNIGAAPDQIGIKLRDLLNDTRYCRMSAPRQTRKRCADAEACSTCRSRPVCATTG